MDQKMKAVTLKNNGVVFETVPKPDMAEAGHVVIQMKACAINPGDTAFITRPLPPAACSAFTMCMAYPGPER